LEIPLVKSRINDLQSSALQISTRNIASALDLRVTSQSVILHFHKTLSPEEVVKVREALTAAGHVVVNGKRVTYPDRS
jgi:hypothetical protein